MEKVVIEGIDKCTDRTFLHILFNFYKEKALQCTSYRVTTFTLAAKENKISDFFAKYPIFFVHNRHLICQMLFSNEYCACFVEMDQVEEATM